MYPEVLMIRKQAEGWFLNCQRKYVHAVFGIILALNQQQFTLG